MNMKPLPYVPPHATEFKREGFTHVWPYETADGRLICYVTRKIDSEGEKKIRPWSWCSDESGNEKRFMRGPEGTRTIYHARELHESVMEDATHPVVLVCEGEKSA